MFIRSSGRKPETSVTKVNHTDSAAIDTLRRCLCDLLSGSYSSRPIVVVCIGTDRSTGDSLGPLVGSRLSSLLTPDACHIYGTLEDPVHAMNLRDTIDRINNLHHDPFIIAIDACLGQLSSVGCVTVAAGPLKPGAGVHKDLPEIGELHMTGIVNVGGFMEYLVLQNTRLSIVMQMAECIASSLAEAIQQVQTASIPLPRFTSGLSGGWWKSAQSSSR